MHRCLFFLSENKSEPREVRFNIRFWRESFLWKCCVFNWSTFNYKRLSSFFKKVFVFPKTYFEVKVLKTFNIFNACHRKYVDLLTLFRMRGAKRPPTNFFPLTYTNIGISPQNILTFSFNLFARLV